jgi:hypothetical protein
MELMRRAARQRDAAIDAWRGKRIKRAVDPLTGSYVTLWPGIGWIRLVDNGDSI